MKAYEKIILVFGVVYILVSLLVKPLLYGLIFISFNFLFFFDNFFNLTNKIHPIICWGLVFLFIGLIIGLFVSINKFNLNPRFKVYSLVGLLFLFFLIGVASKPFNYGVSKNFHDSHEWEIATKKNTFYSYQQYLIEFPSGMHAIDASAAMEINLWDSAILVSNPLVFKSFIDKFPLSIHKNEAYTLYEETSWSQVISSKTIDNLNNFIYNFPSGKYTLIAKNQLRRLKNKKNDQSVDGSIIAPETSNSQRTVTYPNGDKYVGRVGDSDKKEGKGKFYYVDGRIYQGTFKNDQCEGNGTLSFPDGSKLVGTWVNGEREGNFTFYNRDNSEESQVFKAGTRIK